MVSGFCNINFSFPCVFILLDEVADFQLQRGWKVHSAEIQYMLKIWLSTSTDPLKVLEKLTTSLLSEEKGLVTDTYTSCKSVNFHAWHWIIFKYLARYAAKSVSYSVKLQLLKFLFIKYLVFIYVLHQVLNNFDFLSLQCKNL